MAKAELKGTIVSSENARVYQWFGIQCVSPLDIQRALTKANGEDIIIEVNSGGGEVFAGFEMYTLLKNYKGKVTFNVVGLAGSAASVVITAGECAISPVAMIMIHNAASSASGDYRAMNTSSELLQKVNTSIRTAYKEKTNLTDEVLIELMDKTTWMTAQEALDQGFVDSIMFAENQDDNPMSIYNSTASVLPQDVIEKVKAELAKQDMTGNKSEKPNEIGNTLIPDEVVINNSGTSIINEEKEGGNATMTLAEARAQFPELSNEVEQLLVTAREEGATRERNRMQAIDNIAKTIGEDLVNKAKYEEPVTASELALQAIQNNALLGANYMQSAITDSKDSGVDGVPAAPEGPTDENEDDILAEAAIKAANAKRKVVK